MAFRRFIPLVCMAALPMAAETIIDVSNQATIRLYTGDALRFTISASNFAVDAAMLGRPRDPTGLEFQLISAPPAGAGQFLAALESGDGGLSVPLVASLSFVPGWFHGSRYEGPVSALEGSFAFSGTASQELFAGSGAVLRLFNTGPAVTVGLPPYGLRQDLNATLTNGPLSVGARHGPVAYADPPPPGAAVPEPQPYLLLLCGGAALCLLSEAVRRLAPPR